MLFLSWAYPRWSAVAVPTGPCGGGPWATATEATKRHPEKRLNTRVIYGLLRCTARCGPVQSLYYGEVPQNRCSGVRRADPRRHRRPGPGATTHPQRRQRTDDAIDAEESRKEKGGEEKGWKEE